MKKIIICFIGLFLFPFGGVNAKEGSLSIQKNVQSSLDRPQYVRDAKRLAYRPKLSRSLYRRAHRVLKNNTGRKSYRSSYRTTAQRHNKREKVEFLNVAPTFSKSHAVRKHILKKWSER